MENSKKSFFAFKVQSLSSVTKKKSQSIDNGDFAKFGRIRFLNKSEAVKKIQQESSGNWDQACEKWKQWCVDASNIAHNLAEIRINYFDNILDKHKKMDKRKEMIDDFHKFMVSKSRKEKLDLDLINDDKKTNEINQTLKQQYAQNKYKQIVDTGNHYLLYENKLGYIEGYVQFVDFTTKKRDTIWYDVYITELATKPGIGIAAALLNTLKQKYKSIMLFPADDNARKFYIRMDFEEDTNDKGFMIWKKSNKKLK